MLLPLLRLIRTELLEVHERPVPGFRLGIEGERFAGFLIPLGIHVSARRYVRILPQHLHEDLRFGALLLFGEAPGDIRDAQSREQVHRFRSRTFPLVTDLPQRGCQSGRRAIVQEMVKEDVPGGMRVGFLQLAQRFL